MYPSKIASEMAHFVALLILFCTVWINKSAAGVSGKTQILSIMFLALRSTCLFIAVDISTYSYKLIYVFVSYAILASIHIKFHKTYDTDSDHFRLELPILVTVIRSIVAHYHEPHMLQILWTFSNDMDIFVLLPQVFMIYKLEQVKLGVFLYLVAMCVYKILHIHTYFRGFYDKNDFDAFVQPADYSHVTLHVFFWVFCLLGVVKVIVERPPCLDRIWVRNGVDEIPLVVLVPEAPEDGVTDGNRENSGSSNFRSNNRELHESSLDNT